MLGKAGLLDGHHATTHWRSLDRMEETFPSITVESELHVWDGLYHAFFYDIDLPESREAYHVMARFFGKHMGLQIKP